MPLHVFSITSYFEEKMLLAVVIYTFYQETSLHGSRAFPLVSNTDLRSTAYVTPRDRGNDHRENKIS
jgi:hypothetical protein